VAYRPRPDPRIGRPRPRKRQARDGTVLRLDAEVFDRLSVLSGTLGTLDQGLLEQWGETVTAEFTEPLAAAMRRAGFAFHRHGPRLARTIQAGWSRGMPTLKIGSLREPTWAGAEFGGQRGTMIADRRDPQVLRTVWGKRLRRGPMVIRRRQTMQFLPRARHGWIALHTWRVEGPRLTGDLVAAMDRQLADMAGV